MTAMVLQNTARAKIEAAAAATRQIDTGDLWPAVARLTSAGSRGNGAGIYADLARFCSALNDLSRAIAEAQQIVRATNWPTDEDYDLA